MLFGGDAILTIRRRIRATLKQKGPVLPPGLLLVG
jgi:hypothetical protein